MISNSLRYCSSLKEVTFLLMVHSKPHSIKSYNVVLLRNLYSTNVSCIPRLPRTINLSCSQSYCSKSPSDKAPRGTSDKSKKVEPSIEQNHIFNKELVKKSLAGTKSTEDENRPHNDNNYSKQDSSSTSPGQHSPSENISKTTLGMSDAAASMSVVRKDYSEDVKRRVEDWSDMFKRWYIFYQDAAGISEVQRAQEKVNGLMDTMSSLSTRRRELQEEQAQLHLDLDSVHSRITDTPRYSDEHTALFEQARQLNTSLLKCKREFESTEGRERDCLMQVMSAIRVSHETERAQQQHTNYRTVAMSLVSAAVASVVTFIANLKRTRDTNSRIEKTEQHANSLHQDAKVQLDQLGDQVKDLFTSNHAEAMLRLGRLEAVLLEGGAVEHKGRESVGRESVGRESVGRELEEGLVTRDTLRSELNNALGRNYSALVKVLRKLVVAVNRTNGSGGNGDVASDINGSDGAFNLEEDTDVVAGIGEGFPVVTGDDFEDRRPSSSVYSISVYMATGAIIGTLMTAVACGGFK